MTPDLLIAHSSPAARGFPASQVIPATIVTLLATAQILALAVRYRQGRLPWLDRVAAAAGRRNGFPPYVALPAKVASLSLIVAAFGFYWDVGWHIDRGRDDGPFSTPAHYPIVFGLAGIGLAGLLAVILDRDPEAPVRLPLGLRSSVGGALLLLCGVVALNGFPLDDIWHTLFGQDVTLWSPTHIQMVGGASLSTLALWMLIEEGRRRNPATPGPVSPGATVALSGSQRLRRFFLRADVRVAGSVLIGLSTLQGEFDFGVPQFPPLCQPVLIVLAASIALVAARIKVGPGGAVGAVLVFWLIRGGMALVIGGALGRSWLHLPLYLAEALLIEAIAAWRGTERQVSFGLLSGLAVGTIGLAAEWAWTQVAMPLPWRASMFPSAVVLGVIAGLSGGVLGGLIGRALTPQPRPRQATPRGFAAAAMAGALAVLAFVVPIRSHGGWVADLELTPATSPDAAKAVSVTVTLPSEADAVARDAAWWHVLAWQGGNGTWGSDVVGQRIIAMDRIGENTWRSAEPVPVDGNWKSFLRLATPTSLQAVPIFLPVDTAIPAPEVPASPRVSREFVTDHQLLQREAVGGSEGVKSAAYIGLGIVGLAWILAIALGARRLERVLPVAEPDRPRRRVETS